MRARFLTELHTQRMLRARFTNRQAATFEKYLSPHSPDDGLNCATLAADLDIDVSTLFWIDRGSHGAPGG